MYSFSGVNEVLGYCCHGQDWLPRQNGVLSYCCQGQAWLPRQNGRTSLRQTNLRRTQFKRDPTPALQRKLNSTLLTIKKTNVIDTRRNRLRCSVPQPPKLYGLPKLHKAGFMMRFIGSLCGSPTYQLSKYLTTILEPLTDKSRRKLQSSEGAVVTIHKKWRCRLVH